jgi:hypothetical protein
MIFGVLLLMAVFATFTVTHFLEFTPDQSPVDFAGELSLIMLSGIFLIAGLVIARHSL